MIRNIVVGLMLTTTVTAIASEIKDLDRIRKDARVMSNVVDSAFEADRPCDRCSISIDGKYLADQGMLFVVRSATFVEDDNGFFHIDTRGLEDVHIMSGLSHIPEMVHEIIDRVEIDIDDNGRHAKRRVRIIDRDSLDEMRDIRRDRRDLEETLSETEISLIHASEEEKEALERRIDELQDRVTELSSRESALNAQMRESRSEYEQEFEARKARQEQERQSLQQEMENVVLTAFCDYGSTLKHLPRSQHISLVFEHGGERDQVMVFNRDDVIECNGNNLRSQATEYLF